MDDKTLTIVIASLTILLGVLILITRINSKSFKKDKGNPAESAARIEFTILGIVLVIGGLIVIIREI